MNDQELELIQKNELLNKKLEELSSDIVKRASEDRVTAKEVYEFIRKEIEKIETDYDKAVEEYEKKYEEALKEQDIETRKTLYKNLGRRPYKKSIVDYVEQLNKSLEMSINSSDILAKLLDTIARMRAVKKVEIGEVNFDRKLILEEIIQEEKDAVLKDSNKLNN